jgi:hypothetical protein
VVDAMQRALAAWLAYRDEVALACGLERPILAAPRAAFV